MRLTSGVVLLGLSFFPAAFATTFPGEQSVGFYAKGSLVNPNVTDTSGQGFIVLYPVRERSFSSKELSDLLENSSHEMAQRFPGLDRVQFGDFSARDGGPLTGHASHQNGLDGDISYFRMDHREQVPGVGDGFDEPFVKDGKITSNFDTERNFSFIRFMVSSGMVGRIFVDPVIKKTLCEFAGSTGKSGMPQSSLDPETVAALHVLRPYPGHNAHMHVRIFCPKDSPRCIAQDPPPAGDGCQEVEPGPSGLLSPLAEALLIKKVELEIPE